MAAYGYYQKQKLLLVYKSATQVCFIFAYSPAQIKIKYS